MSDTLTRDLAAALDAIPLIDPHSHIDPHAPVSKTLDDILGYHYYTELAHSAGMPQAALAKDVPPRERVREIVRHMARFDNTAQYAWFVDIAKTFLGFEGDRVTAADADALFDAAEKTFAQPDWETKVIQQSRLEKIFLTNEFDDPLSWVGGLTAESSGRIEEPTSSTTLSKDSISAVSRQTAPLHPSVYVPCLRTDTLVFHLDKPDTRQRLAKATGVEVGDLQSLRKAVWKLFAHFKAKGAKACAISLPPDFTPSHIPDGDFDRAIQALTKESALGKAVFGGMHFARSMLGGANPAEVSPQVSAALGTFWLLAEHCREFALPFDLMIGVNRKVYEKGVFQGQDLFNRTTSLIQYRDLFNAFPEVTFPVSVLTSGQNQELVAYSWIFPNVATNGHWWYSNISAYIRRDLGERLQAVPKTKQIGYYSDAYKLEFVLPKYAMYRRILAETLADDFVRPGRLTETEAVALGTRLLRDNVREMFQV